MKKLLSNLAAIRHWTAEGHLQPGMKKDRDKIILAVAPIIADLLELGWLEVEAPGCGLHGGYDLKVTGFRLSDGHIVLEAARQPDTDQ